ncbi:uncharacterized protein BO87DRAFT_14888 [Aspergillus neoniger CBS 115656]|uniref:Uncharacterized protein n=1 Tax=Aspergillus neoniger (strain CBS 115656) TaxID=1448310 RepID=A0A318YNW0_ASPNB|nr:hypothetical protein BO87DRAFT_14888 [Aspergillus neoniger CBS 115656]PYH35984.1 hypothetical protein BO87DRAFT_14888 [Aspergillus neoniger CBS 115656]
MCITSRDTEHCGHNERLQIVLLTGLRCQTMLCISLAMSCNASHLSGSIYGDASPIMLMMLLHKGLHAMRFGALSVS